MQSIVDRPCDDNVDKWQVLRDLTKARRIFGLGSRTLTVLSALLSFHPARHLGGDDPLIVFPSNRSLSERAHGMSEATLRRHLAALVDAGLLLRHDSPNGKRYAARDRSGTVMVAFGFDLRPLLMRHEEIAGAAQQVEDQEAALRRLREAVILRLRDCTVMLETLPESVCSEQGPLLHVRRILRRKPDVQTLTQAFHDLCHLLESLTARLPESPETRKMSGKNSETERHYQNSKPDTFFKDSATRTEPHCAPQPQRCTLHGIDPRSLEMARQQNPSDAQNPAIVTEPNMDLTRLLEACPAVQAYSKTSIESWEDLHRSASQVSPWLGIDPKVWNEAQQTMGPLSAAVTVAAILERRSKIKTPAAYLRALCQKAQTRGFNPMAMINALLDSRQPEPS